MRNEKTVEMTWNFNMSSAPVFEHLIITYIDDSGDMPFSVVTIGEQNYNGDWYDICNGEFIQNYKVCAYMRLPKELPVKELRRLNTVNQNVKNTTKLEITGATLLTIDEARELPTRLREYKYDVKYGYNEQRWWLKSPSYAASYLAAYVTDEGVINRYGFVVYRGDFRIRPALEISNLESSGLEIGDTFEFGNKEFEIISNNKAFCLTDIGTMWFREDLKAPDANDYEKSDVKKYIDKWFEKYNDKSGYITLPVNSLEKF